MIQRTKILLFAWALFAPLARLDADCTYTNSGLTPLPELGLKFYKGFLGGLYPNGANNRPPAHLATGLQIATNQIAPLNSNGTPDSVNGKIALLSIGMSNTTQEWASKGTNTFRDQANRDPSKNSQLIIVDGAQGGQDATTWTNLNQATWSNVLPRLMAAGVTTNQVQAIWMKQAIANETGALTNHAKLLQSYLEQIVRNAKIFFPNLKIVYVSSRTRAYVANTGLNPEPYAYETAFAAKWMIEKQIRGANDLNFDSTKGVVVAPYLSWGPYLWVDGTTTRSDGLTWLCSDLVADFTHPSTNGVEKVGSQLLAFFKTDPTATPWFLKKTMIGQSPACSVSANVTNGTAPLAVNFSATADAIVTNFVWTFDDGTFSFAQNPTKIFAAPGNYQVHLTVTDSNGNTAQRFVAINVTTTLADWKATRFTSIELTNSVVSGDSADLDNDYFPNLLEYALGLDPKIAETNVISASISNRVFTFSFPHFKAATDVTIIAEVSTNLTDWSEVTPTEIFDNGPFETITLRENGTSAARFFRLKASR
ncbi:MAG: PKD domain-containing protein [Verrucomicrobiota bacterium]|nr:PKD domain-containing protein [Verrucomicrobiota bacterium]